MSNASTANDMIVTPEHSPVLHAPAPVSATGGDLPGPMLKSNGPSFQRPLLIRLPSSDLSSGLSTPLTTQSAESDSLSAVDHLRIRMMPGAASPPVAGADEILQMAPNDEPAVPIASPFPNINSSTMEMSENNGIVNHPPTRTCAIRHRSSRRGRKSTLGAAQ